MNGLALALMIVLMLLVPVGCGGGGDGGGPGGGASAYAATLQGRWGHCFADSGGDRAVTIEVAGSNGTTTSVPFASLDGSCSGAAGTPTSVSWTFVTGGTVVVGGVPAHAMDRLPVGMDASFTEYDVVFVDTAAVPKRLYLGDPACRVGGPAPDRPICLLTFWYDRE